MQRRVHAHILAGCADGRDGTGGQPTSPSRWRGTSRIGGRRFGVTLVYPWEAPDPGLIAEWLRSAAVEQPPFRLRLGPLDRHDATEGVGCGYAVLDIDGGHRALRSRIAPSAFVAGDVDPHVTVVHPRTSRLGEEAWQALRTRSVEVEFSVRDIAITAWEGSAWPTLERVPLTG